MEQLKKKVRRAQRWLGIQRFVGALGWCWLVALLAALAVIVADKFWPTGVDTWIWLAGALALGVLAAAIWAIARGRGPIDAAIEIDRRFRLKERVSSALALSDQQRESDVGKALVDDAIRRVHTIDVNERFTISPGRQILLPLLPLLMAVLVIWLVPPADQSQARAEAAEAVKKQIEKSTESFRRRLVEQRKRAQEEGLKDAQTLFQRLEQATDELADKTDGDRKQALVELRDLAKQLEKRCGQLGGAEQVQKQLNQLKNIVRGPADTFLDEIRRGNFKRAMRELENLRSKLAGGQMTDAQRDALAKQLDQMKEKLEDLADAHRQAREDLQKRIDQARKAGNEQEVANLEDQLDKLRQQLPQINRLDDLAATLGQASRSLRDGQLQDADGLFGQMEADLETLQKELNELDLLEEAMDQLAQARDQMNCPLCGGGG